MCTLRSREVKLNRVLRTPHHRTPLNPPPLDTTANHATELISMAAATLMIVIGETKSLRTSDETEVGGLVVTYTRGGVFSIRV